MFVEGADQVEKVLGHVAVLLERAGVEDVKAAPLHISGLILLLDGKHCQCMPVTQQGDSLPPLFRRGVLLFFVLCTVIPLRLLNSASAWFADHICSDLR